MGKEVIYNGQPLTLTRFWATNEPCLWIREPEQRQMPKMEFVGGYPTEFCIFLKNLTPEELARITLPDGSPIDIEDKTMGYLNIQPLRIPPNWTIKLNKLENIDPETLAPEDENWLFAFNEDIIYMESQITREQNQQIEEQKLGIDLGWYPDGEPDGKFILQAILNEDWDDPLMKFSSRSKDEIVKTLEKWLWEDFMPVRFIDEEYFHKTHRIKLKG